MAHNLSFIFNYDQLPSFVMIHNKMVYDDLTGYDKIL